MLWHWPDGGPEDWIEDRRVLGRQTAQEHVHDSTPEPPCQFLHGDVTLLSDTPYRVQHAALYDQPPDQLWFPAQVGIPDLAHILLHCLNVSSHLLHR